MDRVCHGGEVEVEIGHITATIRKERGMDTCLRLLSTLSVLVYNPGSSQGMAPPTVDRSPHLRELNQENLSQARPEAQCFHTVKCTVNTFSALLFISYGREGSSDHRDPVPLPGHTVRECRAGLGFRPYCPFDPVYDHQ